MAKIIRFPVERVRRDVMMERQVASMPLVWLPFAMGTYLWLYWTGAWLGGMGSASGSLGRKGKLARRGDTFRRRT
ncbi:hypothetical protein [Litchfieldella rifensis]|uniref:Uncharacterized protein n=1 Tax=Litchfieldella rifensis TaxID=762643 RepID=A0ABV7LUK5_9GAMM